MFSEIEKINWSELKQAHGYSSHIPHAIQGLISNNYKEQEASYWKLDNHIVLQGDLYQASFYVIPFLIEILKKNILNGRDYVYDLLFEIVNGFAPEEVLCIYNNKEYDLTDACKKSIADNFKVFLFEVSNSTSNCREKALDMLISLEYNQKSIVIELLKIIENEKNNDFSIKIDEAISEIQGQVGN